MLPAALHYPPEELEANQFAAALLMPAPMLDRLPTTRADLTDRVAERFAVSTGAAEKRLEYLRCLKAHRSWDKRRLAPSRADSGLHGHAVPPCRRRPIDRT
jgi:Zn-dependent peptidase ImmA (M78 family)